MACSSTMPRAKGQGDGGVRSLAAWRQEEEGQTSSVDVQALLGRVRGQLALIGPGVLRSLSVGLESSPNLSLEPLLELLHRHKLPLSRQELKALLLSRPDHQQRPAGLLILDILRPKLAGERLECVHKAFHCLDREKRGKVSLSRVLERIDGERHPDVMSRRKTREQVMAEIRACFGRSDGGEGETRLVNDEVEIKGWENSLSLLSACVPNEEYFKLIIEGIWSRREDQRERGSKGVHAPPRPFSLYGQTETSSVKVPSSVLFLVGNLRKELGKSGIRGFLGLRKSFERFQGSDKRGLSLTDLRIMLKENGLSLSDSELRLLWSALEEAERGQVMIETVLGLFLFPLSRRRQLLVRQAYLRVSKESKDRRVLPQGVLSLFNYARHPLVLSGQVNPQALLQEFLATFEVPDEREGEIDRERWEGYFTALSNTIPSDELFELIMHNVWGVRGGEEEELFFPVTPLTNEEEGRGREGKETLALAPLPAATRVTHPPQEVGWSEAESIAVKRDNDNGPSLFSGSSGEKEMPARTLTPLSPDQGLIHSRNSVIKKGNPLSSASIDPIVCAEADRIRRQLASRSIHGICRLYKELKKNAEVGQKISERRDGREREERRYLSFGGWKRALRACELQVPDSSARISFDALDLAGSGSVSCEDLLRLLRGEAAYKESRRSLILSHFDRLDVGKRGSLDPRALLEGYHPANHPEVVRGSLSAAALHQEFLEMFEISDEKEGLVSRVDWLTYHLNVSAAVDSDQYFQALLEGTWGPSGSARGAAEKEDIKVLRRLVPFTELLPAGSQTAAVRGLSESSADRQSRLLVYSSGHGASACLHGDTSVTTPLESILLSPRRAGKSSRTRGVPPGVQVIISFLYRNIRSRGLRALILLLRQSRKQPIVTTLELRRLLAEAGATLPDQDLRALAAHFEDCGAGGVDMGELLEALRPPLKAQRLQLVEEAYRGLCSVASVPVRPPTGQAKHTAAPLSADSSSCRSPGSAIPLVTAENILRAFNPSGHPDVTLRGVAAENVLEEFLETFEVGADPAGRIPFVLWEDYFRSVSFILENEEEFQRLMRESWHVQLAPGIAQSSSPSPFSTASPPPAGSPRKKRSGVEHDSRKGGVTTAWRESFSSQISLGVAPGYYSSESAPDQATPGANRGSGASDDRTGKRTGRRPKANAGIPDQFQSSLKGQIFEEARKRDQQEETRPQPLTQGKLVRSLAEVTMGSLKEQELLSPTSASCPAYATGFAFVSPISPPRSETVGSVPVRRISDTFRSSLTLG